MEDFANERERDLRHSALRQYADLFHLYCGDAPLAEPALRKLILDLTRLREVDVQGVELAAALPKTQVRT